MNLFSPDRPKVGDLPAYLSPTGQPIAPMPALHLVPDQRGHVTAWFYLLTGQNNASTFTTRIPISQLPVFIDEWLADPEGVLGVLFQYSYEPQKGRASTPVIVLADLGL